jgi:hypothetical protein
MGKAFTKYPGLFRINKRIIFIDKSKINEEDHILTVENIRGKNYDREPRIYRVKEKQLLLMKQNNMELETHSNI